MRIQYVFDAANDQKHTSFGRGKTDPGAIFTLEVFSVVLTGFTREHDARHRDSRADTFVVRPGAKRTQEIHFSSSMSRKFLRFLDSRHHVRIRSPNSGALGYLPLTVDEETAVEERRVPWSDKGRGECGGWVVRTFRPPATGRQTEPNQNLSRPSFVL